MNEPIAIYCKILKEIVSSATEVELVALFHNGKEAAPLRVALEEISHAQPPTPIVTDNSTACGIANNNVKQRRSKAMDMQYYWILDRVKQGQYIIIGARAKAIVPTTLLSTILPNTISSCGRNTFSQLRPGLVPVPTPRVHPKRAHFP